MVATRLAVVLSLVSVSAASATAQLPGKRELDFAAGAGDGAQSAAASVLWRVSPPAPLGRIVVGYGLRATWAAGDIKMTPAGAKNVPAGVVDTLRVSSVGALMLNATANIAVRPLPRFEAGLNIDIVGFGIGSEADATYRASGTAPSQAVTASPSSSNLFLYGSKDRGSLNSEFYGAIRLPNGITVRGGLAHMLTEYTASRVLSSNTDRFRMYSDLMFVALRFER